MGSRNVGAGGGMVQPQDCVSRAVSAARGAEGGSPAPTALGIHA